MSKVSAIGSLILLTCIIASYFLLDRNAESIVNASMAARVVGLGVAINLLIEYSRGTKNLLRSDILAIVGIYVLTLYEFLFDQEKFSSRITGEQAYGGIELILIGLFFFVIGRHLYRYQVPISDNELKINTRLLLTLFYVCFCIGFLYIFITVNFDPVTMFKAAMGVRFSQPWARGRYGGNWIVTFSELKLFTYAVPPLAGILLNYRKSIKGIHVILVVILLFTTLFMSFAGGTRNVFFTYFIGFLGGFFLTKKHLEFKKVVFPAAIALVVAYVAATYMVQFRSIGLSQFLAGHREKSIDPELVYVDYNLRTIGLLSQAFPDQHDYLGMEVVTWALLKPVPRVLWPTKPEGLSVSMEQVAKVGTGFTLASTYIGESYMGGGIPAIIIASLLFGYFTVWWNTRAANLDGEKLFIYALGLFAVLITTRSLFMLTTAILPVLGVQILLKFLRKK
ncbi:MAG: O-antigen polymerase [Cyclobacteriaceae bacterium]